MSAQRDAKLLPRLMAMLDTLTNEAELLSTLQRIRKIAGADYFAALVADARPAEPLVLTHADLGVSRRLRGLGLMLRLVRHPDSATEMALQRTRDALVTGGAVAPADLTLTLACLRDLLEQARQRQASMVLAGQVNGLHPQYVAEILFREGHLP